MSRPLSADLFCRVIDNLGDIGVMWRLARQLSIYKGWQIRLWVDRLESLATIEPGVQIKQARQTHQGIEVYRWPDPWEPVTPPSVVIAGFSCELPHDYLKQLTQQVNPIWIQLDYLSAERWVGSFHGLRSQRNDALDPVFFFPGFRSDTGGLLREPDLLQLRQRWQIEQQRPQWLRSIGVKPNDQTKLVSVFTYPSAPLHLLIDQLQQTGERFHLLLPSTQTQPIETHGARVTWQAIEFLSQRDYDKLLWSCAINLVRGEDSFVRAIWAGQPLMWQIYPQMDGAHHAKLQAWLELADMPKACAQAMHEWADGQLITDLTTSLTGPGWQQWCHRSEQLAQNLSQQTDLATRLDTWVRRQSSTADRL